MLKKTALAGFVAAALAPSYAVTSAQAADAPSPHTLTGNVGLYSQYIFRGLTQTNRDPAVQGGFDYAHSSGFYAGTWASNISWLRDGGSYNGGGSGEFDFYGGYKGDIGKTGLTFDVGTLYYLYPGDVNTPANAFNIKADTWEIYGALGWKWFTAKYSHSISNKTFGVRDSSGTYYLDLSAALPLGGSGFTLGVHYGIQKFKGTDIRNAVVGGRIVNNDTIFSYNDWKVELSYTLPKDFTIGAFYTDTSSVDARGYGSVAQGGVYPRNIAKGTGTFYLKKAF